MPGLFCEAVRKIRARLVAPPINVQDYLATLAGQGLVATAAGLAAFSALLRQWPNRGEAARLSDYSLPGSRIQAGMTRAPCRTRQTSVSATPST